MTLVYDLRTGTYVCIRSDATIFGFQRVSRTKRINPIAIRVDQMDITLFGKTRVEPAIVGRVRID
ncbi:hypothetical protein [Mesorhizobium sp. IMUNJ 23232]|uniref:hypothetical protein n=1 Tax=Mesorhizobium sp. IMUNJ 23232 TaxID=3376064 RepID=UPI0037A5D89A